MHQGINTIRSGLPHTITSEWELATLGPEGVRMAKRAVSQCSEKCDNIWDCLQYEVLKVTVSALNNVSMYDNYCAAA